MNSRYRPLWIAGEARGQIREDVLPVIETLAAIEVFSQGLRLREDREDAASRHSRSEALQSVALALRAQGLIADWRDEFCALLDEHGEELARCERGAFRTLGLQNRSVHVNGYLPDGRLWVARRSQRKKADPGKLDNLAAGAVTAGESPLEAAVRELWEEAGVPAALATGMVMLSTRIHSLRETQFGVHDEIVLVADIELPEDFVPEGQDGEVEAFFCWLPAEVRAAMARGEFTREAELSIQASLARRAPIIV